MGGNGIETDIPAHLYVQPFPAKFTRMCVCVCDVAGPVIEYSDSLKDTQKIKAGKSLVLSVNIIGAPTPKASWWRDDAEVKSGLDVTVEGDGTFSRLTVKNTSAAVSGKYKVVAENSVGSDSAEFSIVILGQFNSHHLTRSCCVRLSVISTHLGGLSRNDQK